MKPDSAASWNGRDIAIGELSYRFKGEVIKSVELNSRADLIDLRTVSGDIYSFSGIAERDPIELPDETVKTIKEALSGVFVGEALLIDYEVRYDIIIMKFNNGNTLTIKFDSDLSEILAEHDEGD